MLYPAPKGLGFFKRYAYESQGMLRFGGQIVRSCFGRPFYLAEFFEQMYLNGIGSMYLVVLTGLFAGLAMATQFSVEFADFGAKTYLGRVMVLAIVRELGPVLAGLMIAARVASGITAEIGSMKSSNQIDAMRAFSIDPIRKLAVPRFLSLLVMVPALTIVADVIAILGGYLTAVYVAHISDSLYWAPVVDRLNFGNLFIGTFKPLVNALIIAFVSIYKGFTSEGGAKGVGVATTQSVVIASITILVMNFISTKVVFTFIRGYFY